MYLQGGLYDLNASILRITTRPQEYGNPPLDWLCKLYNVALKLPGVLGALVVVDTYRAAQLNADDVQLDAYVRLNVDALLQLMEAAPLQALSEPIVSAFQAQNMHSSLRYLTLVHTEAEEDLQIVVDTRKMQRKVGAVVDGDTWTPPILCVAHPSAKWTHAHSLYVFLKAKPVLNLVFALGASADSLVQATMEPVALSSGVEFAYTTTEATTEATEATTATAIEATTEATTEAMETTDHIDEPTTKRTKRA